MPPVPRDTSPAAGEAAPAVAGDAPATRDPVKPAPDTVPTLTRLPTTPAAPTLPSKSFALAAADAPAAAARAKDPERVTPRKMPVIPGYVILGELGRGGMGVIYKADQLSLKRIVALKMILAGAHAGPTEMARFRAEAEAVARLQHPNIVQIYEVGECDGQPFLSLEFVDGGSLARQARATPVSPRDAALLVATLARAMSAAHQRGVVHRDLKPANILLAADGTPKITDFGLAKRLDLDSGQTQSGAILGTPSYMAPEQAGGRGRAIGPATDVYALGAILYELVTRRPPFKAATPLDTVLQVLSEDPTPPCRLQPKVPRDLEMIVLKCLEKRPESRYPTARQLAEDLERFLNYQAILAKPPGTLSRAGKWLRRQRTNAAVAVAATAVAFALALGVSWRWNRGHHAKVAELTDNGFALLGRAAEEADEPAANGVFDQANEQFIAARALDADDRRATDGLLELHLTRCRRALDRGDYDGALRNLLPLRGLDREGTRAGEIDACEHRLLGAGSWQIDTEPPGARVVLSRLGADSKPGPAEDLGVTPLARREIPMGSYVVRLDLAGCARVSYPMTVERGEDKDLHVRLVPADKVPRGMVYVPAGVFLSGDPDAGTGRKAFVDGFFIDRTEVTGADYEEFVRATGSPPPKEWGGAAKCPAKLRNSAVYNVSWFEAVEYARWAGKRLPTDLEWEKAARGVDGRRYPWGNRFEAHRCTWHDTTSGADLVVGRWPAGASPYGCLDMAGNVWEWTADREKPFSALRVIRGGCAAGHPDELTCCGRRGVPPAGADFGALNLLGFRCVASLNPGPRRELMDDLEYRSDLVQAIQLYGYQNRRDKVLACAERILKLNPQSLTGRLWKGNCLAEEKRYGEALAALKLVYLRTAEPVIREQIDKLIDQAGRAGVKVDRDFLAVRELFATAYAASKDKHYPEAEGALKKVLALDPDNPAAHEALGDVCAATGRPEEAARHHEVRAADLRRNLAEDPGRAASYYEFSKFLAARKLHPAEGLAAARRAVELDPENPEFHDTLAEYLSLTGRPDEAVSQAREALEVAQVKAHYRERLKQFQRAAAAEKSGEGR
jgi:formylglycine-generating enzyme required for sulfatase activity